MWTPIVLVAALALAPAQAPAGGLALSNVRSTYGELGGARPGSPLLPGDVLFVCFDIEGITIDPEGKVQYTMGMDILDKAGKTFYKTDPTTKADFVPLGGGKLPGRAYVSVGLDQPPGDYTMKVTVTDTANKATKTLEQKFSVLGKDFGVVAVYASIDERGQIPAPTTAIVGQSVFVQFGVVGFARGGDKKQPNVSIEMVPLDEKGNPTIQKPSVFNLDAGVDEKDAGITVRFLLPLTRPGKFTVRLKATDKVVNKTYTFNLPITALLSAN